MILNAGASPAERNAPMPMAFKGLAKLAEECGELQQVIGKKLAYYHTDHHPDGGAPLSKRLEDEIADVMAACKLVMGTFELDEKVVEKRTAKKLKLFRMWHEKHEEVPTCTANDPCDWCSNERT